jgi:hypothetical protein
MIRFTYLVELISIAAFFYNAIIILATLLAGLQRPGLQWWFLSLLVLTLGAPLSWWLFYKRLFRAANTDGATYPYILSFLLILVHMVRLAGGRGGARRMWGVCARGVRRRARAAAHLHHSSLTPLLACHAGALPPRSSPGVVRVDDPGHRQPRRVQRRCVSGSHACLTPALQHTPHSTLNGLSPSLRRHLPHVPHVPNGRREGQRLWRHVHHQHRPLGPGRPGVLGECKPLVAGRA